jgi:hypothetical protein
MEVTFHDFCSQPNALRKVTDPRLQPVNIHDATAQNPETYWDIKMWTSVFSPI